MRLCGQQESKVADVDNAVAAAAETHYGYAGRVFLEKLTSDKRDWQAHYDVLRLPLTATATLVLGQGCVGATEMRRHLSRSIAGCAERPYFNL
jgi:hypothetical protein